MTDDPVLAELARGNPEPHPLSDPGDEQLLAAIFHRPATAPRYRRSPARILVPVLSAAVVIAVVLVFVRAGGTQRTAVPATSAVTQRIMLRVVPEPPVKVTSAGMRREVALLREHLTALGIARSASVRQIGRDEIAVAYHGAHPLDFPALVRLLSFPQIAFADWEGNLIAPDGRTVASQLPGGSAVSSLSRGGATGTGVAGGMRLYDAVRLASHQPAQAMSSTLSRRGPQYFAFTKSGSYVTGPASTRGELKAPPGARTLTVPQGTVVVQAIDSNPIGAAQYQSSQARFFVLHDHLHVLGPQLRAVTSSQQRGISTLSLSLTQPGQRALHQVTAVIARRGRSLSEPDGPHYQHVAVIKDGALLSVAEIDYRVYPDGITTATTRIPTGIPTGLPSSTTQRIAHELTLGILPLALEQISR